MRNVGFQLDPKNPNRATLVARGTNERVVVEFVETFEPSNDPSNVLFPPPSCDDDPATDDCAEGADGSDGSDGSDETGGDAEPVE